MLFQCGFDRQSGQDFAGPGWSDLVGINAGGGDLDHRVADEVLSAFDEVAGARSIPLQDILVAIGSGCVEAALGEGKIDQRMGGVGVPQTREFARLAKLPEIGLGFTHDVGKSGEEAGPAGAVIDDDQLALETISSWLHSP